MNKYEKIQTRKGVSVYGGIGAIIETREGAIIVKPIDEWPFFQSDEKEKEEYIISDKRFKNRLCSYFTQLKKLIKIPVNDLKQGFLLKNQRALIGAKYFPEWFYCNKCHRFAHISEWKENWTAKVDIKYRDNFSPPKCFNCYNPANRRKFYDLEQVRFILTAPDGNIKDIPWNELVAYKLADKNSVRKTEPEQINNNKELIFGMNQIPDANDIYLKWRVSDKLEDMKGITIYVINKNDNQMQSYVTLSGLFNFRFKTENAKKENIYKPVIRSSNSVYYPNILTSLFIPAQDEITLRIIELIRGGYEDGLNATQISRSIKRSEGIEKDEQTIQFLIDNNFEGNFEQMMSENGYRFAEYDFITTSANQNNKNNLIFSKIDGSLYPNGLIKSIYKMDKIKMTSVQVSYTRQEPISKDKYFDDEYIKKDISTYGHNTWYLPAVESFGEGIFFDFDNTVLINWLEKHRTTIFPRIQIIVDNIERASYRIKKPEEVTPQFLLIHTFSHLIIKELECLCGYSSTSIQERLFIDDNLGMYGVLIYTIAGAEGSYGGITSLCDSDKIGKLIQSAMARACDCATDPICYHTTGQGVGNLNLSACFSCALLPETSCEMFNCFLDRRILIDKEFGYFKDI